ncbi:MAG: response regulator [Rhizobacter sp.]|nr:response regulator [Chlorobiales bacterium]
MMMDRKLKMLLVDDEPLILVSLTQIFDGDYVVFTANNGSEAMKVMADQPDIAIVISDQRMPGIKGVDLLKAVKKVSPNTIRILLTGYADLEAVLASVNVGEVFRYVRKPWVTETLRTIVSMATATYMLRVNKMLHVSAAAGSHPTSATTMASKPLDPAFDQSTSHPPEFQPRLQSQPRVLFTNDEIDKLLSSLGDASQVETGALLPSIATEIQTQHLAKAEVIADFRRSTSFEEEFFAKLRESGEPLVAQPLADDSTFEQLFYRDGKPRVLIVDDEIGVLSSLQEALYQQFDVITCTSADAALDILRHNSMIACMMTDMRMPRKTGAEFLLQAEKFVPLIPKILITSYSDIEDIVKLINKGMLFRYIQKPWDNKRISDTLLEAVAECRRRVEEGLLFRDISLAATPTGGVSPQPSHPRPTQPPTTNAMETLRKLNERLSKKSE